MVVAAATETPRSERAHAVGAHVAEGHGRTHSDLFLLPPQARIKLDPKSVNLYLR